MRAFIFANDPYDLKSRLNYEDNYEDCNVNFDNLETRMENLLN